MKTQTRLKAFETNSSSTHSISISPNDPALNTNINGKKIVNVYTGEYGWEEDSYYGFADNASYVATYILSSADPHLSEGEKWLSPEAINNITHWTALDLLNNSMTSLSVLFSLEDLRCCFLTVPFVPSSRILAAVTLPC